MSETVDGGRRGYLPLYGIVSMSGAAVLALELLGTRILGPFYGVSLFLWSALITVTLAALSAGYAIGGRIADRKGSMKGLALILAAAGVWICLIPLLRRPVIILVEPLGLRLTVLVAATILFFPPLALMGMVSPWAVKLRASTLSEVGRSAGDLYAVSTVASVMAALLTGFVLIPGIAVSRLIFGIGAFLLLAAIIAVLSTGKTGARASVIPLVLFLGAVAAAALMPGIPSAAGSAEVIETGQSPYGEINVVEYREARFLLIDGSIHTFTDAESGDNLFPYVNVLDIPRLMFKDSGRALLIGLGGGSVARRLSIFQWHVDAVEIDPLVVRYAYDHFGLRTGDAVIHEMDGRRFLIETDDMWDLIILDAFGSGAVPFHLITEEMLELVSRRLRPGGIVALNVLTVGWKSEIVRSTAATLETSFRNVIALPIPEPPNTLGNVVLLAAHRPLELRSVLDRPYSRFSEEYDINHAWDNRFRPDTGNALVFTDDRNPVDLWGERINLVDRRHIREYFRDAGFSW
jgi:spermidine synthase